LRYAAKRTGTIMRMVAGLIGLVAGLIADATAIVANGRHGQRIGSSNTGSPAGSYRRQDLHHQSQ
jgi:hypothetical protein